MAFRVVSNQDEALRHLGAGEYVFNNGRDGLDPAVLTNQLRFLLAGWESLFKEPNARRLNAHTLRHAFANSASVMGYELELLSSALDHMSTEMTASYAKLSKNQEKRGEEIVRQLILKEELISTSQFPQIEEKPQDEVCLEENRNYLTQMEIVEKIESELIAMEKNPGGQIWLI
ncbi:tyrosine-type recombinase/integrase (plasmid) [Deinococcus radiomollis]|uniref:hypothetical protein n=1 Tax=Deinococcus radiomollis TaxID=468916 RepID=UPI0038919D03